jgi:hypothetical protein
MSSSAKARDLEKWWSDQRYARLRAGFQQLKATGVVSDRKLHRHCEAIAESHTGFWVPSLSTIERFGERSADVQNTLRGKPRSRAFDASLTRPRANAAHKRLT